METSTRFNPVYYQRLPAGSLRLVRITCLEDGSFHGQLKRFRLADAPPFFTASYTWGNRTFSNEVIAFEKGKMPILHSILPFLRMVTRSQKFNGKDWWWIDSICINLADGHEREVQVSIMAEIYRSAQRAVIWLGEDEEVGSSCTGAIEFLKYLSTLVLAFDKDERIRAQLRGPDFSQHWQVTSNLLSRPWWTRVWTLQEFILSPEAIFACGSNIISRGKFKSAMYNIFLCNSTFRDVTQTVVPRKVFDAAFNRRRVHQWYTNPQTHGMSLVATIAYLGNHLATDPRDRIYSVLGLITARDKKLVGKPEYTTSVKQQYARLVRSFWDEYGSLDIVCFAHIFNRYAEVADQGRERAVPSWTPDWRVRCEFVSPVPLMASQSASEHVGNFRPLHSRYWEARFDAPGKHLRQRANVRFHANLKEFWCDGVVLDEIDALGGLYGCDVRCVSYVCYADERIHGILRSSPGQGVTNLREDMGLVEAIARSLVLDRQDKYLRFVAPPHYVSDFLSLCQATASSSAPTDQVFATWFTQNRHLYFGSYTLTTLIATVTATTPIMPRSLTLPNFVSSSMTTPVRTASFPPEPKPTSTDDADSFLSRFHNTVQKKARRIMTTSKGEIGMAPCRAMPGDKVVILFGCSIPLVLRRVGSREAWQVIGEAYLHGWMNGELDRSVRQGQKMIRRFRMV